MVVLSRVVRFDVIVGRHTNGVALCTQCNYGCCGWFARIFASGIHKRVVQNLADIFYVYLFVKRNDIVTSTSKVDTLAQPPYEEDADEEEHGSNR